MSNCSWRSTLKALHLARERLNGTSGQTQPAIQRAVVYNKVTFHRFWHLVEIYWHDRWRQNLTHLLNRKIGAHKDTFGERWVKFRCLIFPSMFWNGALSLSSFPVDLFYWPKNCKNYISWCLVSLVTKTFVNRLLKYNLLSYNERISTCVSKGFLK